MDFRGLAIWHYAFDAWRKVIKSGQVKRYFMAKAIDLRLKAAEGMKFEDVVKRILAAPPLPKKSKGKKPAKNPRLN